MGDQGFFISLFYSQQLLSVKKSGGKGFRMAAIGAGRRLVPPQADPAERDRRRAFTAGVKEPPVPARNPDTRL